MDVLTRIAGKVKSEGEAEAKGFAEYSEWDDTTVLRLRCLHSVAESRNDSEGIEKVDVEASSHPIWRELVASLSAEGRTHLEMWRGGAARTQTRPDNASRCGSIGRILCCALRPSARHLWAECPCLPRRSLCAPLGRYPTSEVYAPWAIITLVRYMPPQGHYPSIGYMPPLVVRFVPLITNGSALVLDTSGSLRWKSCLFVCGVLHV